METTTRASWAADLFESEEEFKEAQANGETDGLELKYGEAGPYLDEGDYQGPFAGDDDDE
jgi:hypothetical protein